MAAIQRLTKVNMFLKRRSEITEEEFHEHWSKSHGPLVSSWLQRLGVIQYEQVRPHNTTYVFPLTLITSFTSLLRAMKPPNFSQEAS